jgi:hypothetical protein
MRSSEGGVSGRRALRILTWLLGSMGPTRAIPRFGGGQAFRTYLEYIPRVAPTIV